MDKLAVFSANYNSPRPLDPYRVALLESLGSFGIEILYIQATDFYSDALAKQKSRGATFLVLENLRRFRPDAVLFLNAVGRVKEIQRYLLDEGIPSLAWYWDHPGIHEGELIRPGDLHSMASANRTFNEWLENRLGVSGVAFIPFPAFDTKGHAPCFDVGEWKARSTEVLFMGTLWDITRVPTQILRAGGTASQESRHLLYVALENDVMLRNRGEMATKRRENQDLIRFREAYESEARYLREVNDFFSSYDRIRFLKAVVGEGLSIYGPLYNWAPIVEGSAPELSSCFRYENIFDWDRLMAICRGSKIGLNVFHRQNEGGGTNFRFVEYALSGTTILANRNTECERVFPNWDAAVYCDTPEEFKEAVLRLKSEPALAVKLARAAYDTARSEFHIEKVGRAILEQLEFKLSNDRQHSVMSPQGVDSGCGLRKFANLTWESADEMVGPWDRIRRAAFQAFADSKQTYRLVRHFVRWCREEGILLAFAHTATLVSRYLAERLQGVERRISKGRNERKTREEDQKPWQASR